MPPTWTPSPAHQALHRFNWHHALTWNGSIRYMRVFHTGVSVSSPHRLHDVGISLGRRQMWRRAQFVRGDVGAK
jgi:hypothetical protein